MIPRLLVTTLLNLITISSELALICLLLLTLTTLFRGSYEQK